MSEILFIMAFSINNPNWSVCTQNKLFGKQHDLAVGNLLKAYVKIVKRLCSENLYIEVAILVHHNSTEIPHF